MEQQFSAICRESGTGLIIGIPKKYIVNVLKLEKGDILDIKIIGIKKKKEIDKI